MLLETKLEKCILCSDKPPDSREHVIPKCIGGTLEALVVCTSCNSQFGSGFVSQLKKDPSIRMALHYLGDKVPELAKQFNEGIEFYAEGAGGFPVGVSWKGGSWKTKARQRNGNVLEIDTDEVPKFIRNTLKKQGLSKADIDYWVSQLTACENGQKIILPSGHTLVKNEATVQLPKLTEGFVDKRVPVLIAFEFLALCMGNSIFQASFDAVREYIRLGTGTRQVEVLEKRAREYDSSHTVRFRVEDGIVTVFVQFFRWYVFEVRFRNIPPPPRDIVYVEDLENKQILLALSHEEAKQGKWVSPKILCTLAA
jgi:hypothetical protein